MKKRTIISIEEYQPELDFEEAEHSPPFTFPEYQRELLGPRIAAGLTDLAIVAFIYLIFLVTTYLEMPEHFTPDRRVLGIYGVCYFTLVAIYFFLFMLSASQTPGMKNRGLVVVTTEDAPPDPKPASLRGSTRGRRCRFAGLLPDPAAILAKRIAPDHNHALAIPRWQIAQNVADGKRGQGRIGRRQCAKPHHGGTRRSPAYPRKSALALKHVAWLRINLDCIGIKC